MSKILSLLGGTSIASWISGFLALSVFGLAVSLHLARADRDSWEASSRQICAVAASNPDAGTVLADDGKGGKIAAKRKRGQICADAVADLVSFRADSRTRTAAVLAGAQQQHEQKTSADIVTATANAADRRAAAANMEHQDAQVDDSDRVDSNWIDGLNRLGGLH